MATIIKKNVLNDRVPFSGVPYGNAIALHYSLETNASGVYTEGNSTTAIGNGDKVIVGVIDAGTRLDTLLAIVSDGFRASSTGKIGFEYVDGVDDADVPQDADYFFAALDLASAGRTFANNTAVVPVVLPKDAYLVVENGGGNAQNVAGRLDLILFGAMVGRP